MFRRLSARLQLVRQKWDEGIGYSAGFGPQSEHPNNAVSIVDAGYCRMFGRGGTYRKKSGYHQQYERVQRMQLRSARSQLFVKDR
mmetsp:Transcript_25609/g.29759  ORF Transcript_25609/g.29759 Transcript_25609/m.29759 type:complete len:85 (+) Transcript_25609:39-293(+)